MLMFVGKKGALNSEMALFLHVRQNDVSKTFSIWTVNRSNVQCTGIWSSKVITTSFHERHESKQSHSGFASAPWDLQARGWAGV